MVPRKLNSDDCLEKAKDAELKSNFEEAEFET